MNFILVDADYLDYVAFDLIVNFERMLARPVKTGDLCRWIDCIALDGGLRPGHHQTEVAFVHRADTKGLKYFAPADFATELHEQAFADNLGEFTMNSYAVESIVSKSDYMKEIIQQMASQENVERIMIVGNMDEDASSLKAAAQEASEKGKDVTLFTMQPINGRGFSQEILGYSLMAALGIESSELT